MKNLILCIVSILTFSFPVKSITPPKGNQNLQDVYNLIDRILPGKSPQFALEYLSSDTGRFELENKGATIVIKGTDNLSLAKGFNYYLNNYCNISVGWYAADTVIAPKQLPMITTPVKEECRFQNRFFLNYCTFGYTTLWWKWADWERFIDWMALNGINMPLSITGQEYIWQRVWRQFGMTDEQIRAFFTGPAHLPWQRMGNLDRFMGPLPQSFIDNQFELQKQILKRERSFGMKPVLPAFAGHVPKDLKNKYPAIKITDLGSYETGDENDAFFLDPMDPLFVKIQKAYLTEQKNLLGTDHYYGADPFNEMDPPSWEPDYLARVAATIYSGMKAVDPQSIWVQMGWTFFYDRKHWTNPRLEAMIKAVPQGKMLLLDYFCEYAEVWRMTDGFFNAPYLWCYLGNFGGGTQLAAPVLKVSKVLSDAENDPNKRQLTGIGSTLEGFGVNGFMFEWLFDYAWNPNATDAAAWIRKYADRRCGHHDEIVSSAWEKLLPIVYNNQISGVELGNMIQSKPNLKGLGMAKLYDYKALASVLPQFLLADSISKSAPAFCRDLAMLEKQVLANLSLSLRDSIAVGYYAKNEAKFNKYTGLFLDLCDDIDLLTATQHELLLGRWIEQARSFGNTDEEKNHFEKDARILISTWGARGNGETDYASKDWSGMISTYYKPRWRLFFDELRQTLSSGSEPDMKAFDEKRKDFEWQWANTNSASQSFSSKPEGDPFRLCLKLYQKWVRYL